MVGFTECLVLILLAAGASGFALKYILNFNTRLSNCVVPLSFIVCGIVAASWLRDFSEAILFLSASTAQFASFVFVSRFRQRGSFFWHALASLASNGSWYVTMHALDSARSYWWLYALYVAGIVGGRVIGATWAQYVEQKFHIKSDATRDPRLAPGQRIQFITRERTFWVLIASLIFYIIYGCLTFSEDMTRALIIVIGLSILQNLTYALGTRAAQRGNNWFIAITGISAGITFYISAAYLFSKNMPLLLLVPYMLSTTLGSTTGALISMIIERAAKLAPDRHLDKTRDSKPRAWHTRLPYLAMIILVAAWVLLQKPLFSFMGRPIGRLIFPLPILDTGTIPRTVVILSAAFLFFLNEVLQTLMSRAGNRNHTGYHTATCIPKGLVNFFKVSYISLNPSIPDIVPIAVFSGCLGSLCGKDISERIERWLQAKMDVDVDEPAPAKNV